ncbi:MAG: sugar transferase [Gemmatimonadales bacterium]|nr:MAG: sugar transferase [Gemmatimonadales bacterium]
MRTEPRTEPLPPPEDGSRRAVDSESRWGSVSDRNVRRLNVLVAAVGIVVLLPLMVLIALAVRLTSRGPILYTQERVGRDRRRGPRQGKRSREKALDIGRRGHDSGGEVFTMYKFRSMSTPVKGSPSREVWACPADHRITPVGSVLRAYRLDELPQLFNVLRGEMNVVGPRPEQPAIFEELREQVERYPDRQIVLPGITGWAQVNHSYDQSLDDVRRKVEFDLEYIRRRSPSEDLRIMLRTLPVMVGRKGSL